MDRYAKILMFALALALGALPACEPEFDWIDRVEDWEPSEKDDKIVALVAAPYYSAWCSGVAVGPNRFATAHHCAIASKREDIEFLTYKDWTQGAPPRVARLKECSTTSRPDVVVWRGVGDSLVAEDGVCYYETDEPFADSWAEVSREPCVGDTLLIGHGRGQYWTHTWSKYVENFGSLVRTDAHEKRPGDSGGGVFCGDGRLVGVHISTGWYFAL